MLKSNLYDIQSKEIAMTTAFEPPVRGLYFEEFQVGQRIISLGRTITEADIVNFAGLSGDYNQIHTDRQYSQSSQFGQRVAHGLLGLAITSGLAVQTGILLSTVIAFREIDEWKFVKPIYIGDTIHVEMEVVETKEIRRLGGGYVVISIDVKNQEEETVMKGQWKVLVAGKSVK
jgi:3-hydroxybutyryl-CoA dehydratase